LDRAIAKKSGRICVHAGAGPLEVKNFAVKVMSPVGKFNVKQNEKNEQSLAASVKKKVERARTGYHQEKKKKALTKELAEKTRENKEAELETKEAEAKRIQRGKDEKAKKEYQVKCAERKVKNDALEATNRKLKKAVAAHQELVSQKKALDEKIKKGKASLAQLTQVVIDSKKTIDESDENLVSAHVNVSVAYKAALNSLTTAKGHAAAAKAGDSDSPNLKGGLTDKHDEYIQAEAKVKEIHESRANAIKTYHESKLQINDLERSLKEWEASDTGLSSRVAASGELVESIGSQKRTMDEEMENIRKEKEARKKAALIAHQETMQKPVPEPETFDSLLAKLKKSHDGDNAFDLVEKLSEKAREGLTQAKTGPAAALDEEKLANAQAQLNKYTGRVKAMTQNPTPEVKAAEEKLTQAEKSGNPAAIQAAQAGMRKVIETAPEDLAHLKASEKALEVAKATGDKAKIQAAQKMLDDANEAISDPSSLAAKVQDLKTALAKARKDCHYNPNDEKVLALQAELKQAQKAAAAEYNGRQVELMIKQAGEASAGNITPNRKQEEERPNIKIAQAEAELQAAKDGDDQKRVQELQKRIAELKQKDSQRAGKPAI